MKVVVFFLCGGLVYSVKRFSQTIPKPVMVEKKIGYRPLMWH